MSAMSALRPRPTEDVEDGAALVLVMFVVLLLSGISLLVLGTVLSRVVPTASQQKRAQTLAAAEAGVQAGLSAIRNSVSSDAANTGDPSGDRNLLPCWTDEPGAVSRADGSLKYATTVTYYTQNPANQPDEWRASHKLSCVPGSGPTSGPPNYYLPNYAVVSADGIGPAIRGSSTLGNRRMEAVYTFKLSTVNIVGGTLGWGNLCFDAGDNPQAGDQVMIKTCDSGRTLPQLWSHTSDYLIHLAQTASAANGGLCLALASAADAGTVATQVQTCDSSSWLQRWGFDGTKRLFARAAGNTSVWCLNNSGVNTALLSNAKSGSCSTASVTEDPRVGPGAAGTTSANVDGVPLQWVNYQKFGTCFDVTNWKLSTTLSPSEILYSCKQDPLALVNKTYQADWNQVMTWSSSTRLMVMNGNSTDGVSYTRGQYNPSYPTWCMKSPLPGATAPLYVTFDRSCDKTAPQYQWTVNRGTGSQASSYTVVDGYGRCLAAGQPNSKAYTGDLGTKIPSVVVADCDGSAAQKWNAPPLNTETAVSNFRERTAG